MKRKCLLWLTFLEVPGYDQLALLFWILWQGSTSWQQVEQNSSPSQGAKERKKAILLVVLLWEKSCET
jgi:hypothetical protein